MFKTILTLSCALLGLAACQDAKPPAVQKRTILVQTAQPAPGMTVTYTGEIRARHEADLAFRVSGRLQQRRIELGDIVQPGQPLAQLDPEDLRLASDAAGALVSAAESELATARAEHQRNAELLARKFISQAAFDAKTHALRSAEARLEQSLAQLNVAKNQRQYTTLSSPYNAVVTAILAEAGQVVGAGQPIVRVARPDEKEVLIAIPEHRRDEIRAARSLTVDLWANPKIQVPGVLRELSPIADPATRTYAARIRLIDPPAELALGMSARVRVGAGDGQPLLVPLAAILDRGQGPAVWIAAEGKVTLRPVTVGQFLENGAIVTSGLQANDQVVIAAVQQLTPDQPVEVRQLPPPAEQR